LSTNSGEFSAFPGNESFDIGSHFGVGQIEVPREKSGGETSPWEVKKIDSHTDSDLRWGVNDELFRMMIETVTDYAIFMLDPQGNVVSWNAGAARIKGYTSDEVVGQNLSIFYPPEEVSSGKPQKLLSLAIRDGRIEDDGWRVRKDGTRFWAHVVITPMFETGGNLLGFSKITRDLTAQKQTDDALRKSEQRVRELVAELEAALDTLPIPIFRAHDPECLHMTGNRAAEAFLRIPRGAEASLSAPDGVRPAHFKAFRGGCELKSREMPTQCAARGITVRDFDFEFLFDDGTIRKMLGYAVPLWNESGQVRGAITVLVDITERVKVEMNLKLTEERLRLALETVKIGTFEDDLLTGEMFWNSVEYELIGLRPGDAPPTPETFFRFVHPKDAEALYAKWEQAKRTGEYESEFRIIRADGQERWLAGKGRLTGFEDGTTQGAGHIGTRFLGVNYDITERKQVELALVNSEKQFRAFFENAGVGLAQINSTGRFTRVNDCFCEITGYSREQLTGGMRPTDLDHPDERSLDEERSAKFISGEISVYDVAKRYLRQNGTSAWVHVTATACRNADGTLEFSAGVIRDITERRLAEQALQDKKRRLRSILDTAADAIIVFDLNGVIDTVNPAAEQMFGYPASEMLGQNVKMLMPAPFQEKFDSFFRRYHETADAGNFRIGREAIGIRKDGTLFPIDLSASSVDHLGIFTAVLRNITERKRLEKHVLEIAAEEQRRIAQELHDGTQQELAGMTMLAEVMINLLNQLPQKDLADPGERIFDARIYRQLSEISNKLWLRLSEASKHVRDLSHGIMPVHIDPEGLRSALAQLAYSTDKVMGISCQFECGELVDVENSTTATNLFRIAQESLKNAIQHGRANQIQISMGTQSNRFVLEIRDNGIGFDPENLPTNSVTNEIQGMGLRIMEYRARMIGGTLIIRRQDKGGMSVKCEVLSARI
jgi:two-component system, LuxR family, sensor kinase FixL